ncbi:hypothetical protein GCM10020295_15450 [Streptomyces cinereospinus]
MKTSLGWDGEAVIAVDQRALPGEYRLLRLVTVDELIGAIQSLAIRGAPALGLAGALGVALSALRRTATGNGVTEAVTADASRIAQARPTAVNLEWGVRRALGRLGDGPDAVLAEALAMIEEDTATNRAAALRAADLVLSLTERRPLRILTHCNTGRLATAAGGTALGAILELAERDCVAEVLVDETRPLLQGSRLTAWELGEAGVPYRICVDSAAAAAMARGLVDCVLVGADRIAANGDVANKIGTYGLAVAAAHHGIPFLVVAPRIHLGPDPARGIGHPSSRNATRPRSPTARAPPWHPSAQPSTTRRSTSLPRASSRRRSPRKGRFPVPARGTPERDADGGRVAPVPPARSGNPPAGTCVHPSLTWLHGADMTLLITWPESGPQTVVRRTSEPAEIAAALAPLRVRYEQWPVRHDVPADADGDTVLAAYRSEIDRLNEEEGFVTVDVVSLHPETAPRLAGPGTGRPREVPRRTHPRRR